MSQINHPSIIKFIFYSPFNLKKKKKPVIITEFASNGSLADLINTERQTKSNNYLNNTNKIIIIYGIASAMSYIHYHDIIHRDLKPDNILLDAYLHPKISDFGLSKKSSDAIKGTLAYMSPEIFFNHEYTKSGDVYAFGIMMYEILTLENPFCEYNFYEIYKALYHEERPPLNSSINECYKSLIKKCWSQDTEKRPTFDQIVAQLKTNPDFLTDSVDKEKYFNYIKFIDECEKGYDPSIVTFYQVSVQPKDDNKKIKEFLKFPNLTLYPYYEYIQLKEENSKELVQKAENQSEEQFLIAQYLIEGKYEFPCNRQLGIRYLKHAIEKQNIEAVIYYIKMLIKGNIIEKNHELAKKLLEIHLKENNKEMYSFLYGKMLVNENKYDEALSYFMVNSNPYLMSFINTEASYEYAKMLFKGKGVKKDQSKAIKLFQYAIMDGFPKAMHKLGLFLISQKQIKQGLNLLKQASDNGYAKSSLYLGQFIQNMHQNNYQEYYKIGADGGNEDAMVKYSNWLSDHKDDPNIYDIEIDLKYLKKASSKNQIYGIYYYGFLLCEELKNPNEGLKYVKIAADNGITNAMNLYAKYLISGDGIQKDIEEGIRYLKMAIDEGNVLAMGNLAYFLSFEKIGSIEEAIKYYEMAIINGNDMAMNNYGYMLQHGIGVPVDKKKAIFYYKEAIKKGNTSAMNNYAIMLNNGEGTDVDESKAFNYYKKVALETGDPTAMYNYASMLIKGNEDNKLEALYYYKESADKGDIEAIIDYSLILLKGEIIEADALKASEYLKKGIEMDDSRAMFHYADMLFDDKIKNQKDGKKEAIQYFKKSADKGNVDAMMRYASILYSGDGINSNIEESMKYFKMAADEGEVIPMTNYAFYMLKNESIPNHKEIAAEYYRKAIEKGSSLAMFRYAEMLHDGIGVQQNKAESLKYFKMAADKGNAIAMNNYAFMLSNGDDVPVDKEEARKYFKMAADAGDESGLSNYIDMLIKNDDNKEEAAMYCKNAADKGSVESMFLYGKFLYGGSGVQENKENAFNYFKMAADKGHAISMAYCGLMLLNGDGIPDDKESAQFYLDMAKKNGIVFN